MNNNDRIEIIRLIHSEKQRLLRCLQKDTDVYYNLQYLHDLEKELIDEIPKIPNKDR